METRESSGSEPESPGGGAENASMLHNALHAWGASDTQIKVALIGMAATLGAALITGVFALTTGVLSFNASGKSVEKGAPKVVVTVTETHFESPASVPSGAVVNSPLPPSVKPRSLADLNATGDSWLEGSWSLHGKVYRKSIAVKDLCTSSEEQVVYDLHGRYRRFTATVGVDDSASSSDDVVSFFVYMDADDDEEPDSGELVASKAATRGRPGQIDAPIAEGLTKMILVTSTDDCVLDASVWGSPMVS